MTELDWIILIVVGLGAILGFMKGLIKQLASIVGLIAGLLIARAMFVAVGEKLAAELDTSLTFAQVLAFILIWIIVPVLFLLMGNVLTRVIEVVHLGFVNRMLGAGVGALKFLLLVGWAPEGEQEIFSLDEMIKIWDPARISKSPAIFDPLKLRAINAAYIRALPAEEFRRLADPFIDSAVHCDIDRDLLCANLQPRCEVLEDIPPQLDFFDAVLPIDAEMYRNKKQKTTPESAKEALTALLPVLEAQTDWTRDAIFEACKTLAEQLEKKNGWLLFPLGIALSGKARTPGGGTDLAAMMGREETLKRVKAALEKL